MTKSIQPKEGVEAVAAGSTEGVTVKCVRENGKLRIKPVSQGYHGK